MNADGGGFRVITSGPGIHEVPSWSPDGDRIVFDYSPDNPDTPGFETRLWTMRPDGTHARPLPMSPPGFDTEPKYSPNGRWIVFARLREDVAEDEAAVFITGAAGGRVRQLTPWHAIIEHPTWSPDSRWIAFNTPEGTIEAIRPDGSERHTILPALEGRGGHKPWFSPDGTRILFMCENQGLTTPGKFENFPSWAPAPSGRGER
jgi:Tol biopolymer transport system component